MTDTERQELYTLMQQWGRNDDIRYQKVREWVEAKFDPLQSERDALREGLCDLVQRWRSKEWEDGHMAKLDIGVLFFPAHACADDLESALAPASGEPAREP